MSQVDNGQHDSLNPSKELAWRAAVSDSMMALRAEVQCSLAFWRIPGSKGGGD